jgi:hypothetical protein
VSSLHGHRPAPQDRSRWYRLKPSTRLGSNVSTTTQRRRQGTSHSETVPERPLNTPWRVAAGSSQPCGMTSVTSKKPGLCLFVVLPPSPEQCRGMARVPLLELTTIAGLGRYTFSQKARAFEANGPATIPNVLHLTSIFRRAFLGRKPRFCRAFSQAKPPSTRLRLRRRHSPPPTPVRTFLQVSCAADSGSS